MLQIAFQFAQKLAPLVFRTASRYGVRTALRSPSNIKYLSNRYGKLSPLAKRSVESFGSGLVSTLVLDNLGKKYQKGNNIKHYNFGKSMPYGYARSRSYGRSYSRYSRYPRRYSSYRPMYRRRSYRRF